MSKSKIAITGMLALWLFSANQAFAHTPICACFDNGDGTVTCEGGFSDGSSAALVEMRVEDKEKKVLIKGKMDEDSEYTFQRPSVPYKVIFNAGDGHVVEIEGDDIEE